MWNFVYLRIKNLYSHSDSIFNFKKNELVQIIGQNKDNFKSNGAGKSGILDGIYLALIAKTGRKTNKEDFIRNGEKECEVELLMTNDFLKKKIEIKRIFKKGSSLVELKINDKDYKLITNTRTDPNKLILENIGLTAEDLQNYFIISQNNKNSFLTTNDTTQKEIIGRFSNFELLDKIEENLKQEVKELISQHQSSLSEEFTKRDSLKNLLEISKGAKEQFEKDKEEKLKEKKYFIQYQKKIIQENKDSILEIEKELNNLPKIISKEKLQKQESKLSSSRLSNRKLIQEAEKDISSIEKKIGKYNVALGGEVECPKCGETFIPGNEFSISEIKKRLKKLKNSLEENNKVKSHLKEENKKIEEKQIKIRGRINEITGIKFRKEELEDKLITKKRDLNYNVGKKKLFIDEYNQIKKLEYKHSLTEKKIKEVEIDLNNLNKSNSELVKRIEEKEFYLYHVGKKGFKTYLSNQAIERIEEMTNFYLKKFSSLSIKINGYKILKDKTVREKIDISVSRDGIIQENFYKFSGGEQSIVNICCLLALQKLINNSLESGGLNFLALDEYIISMDEKNEMTAIDLLSNTKITTVLVMQHTISYGKNIVNVIKEKGISQIINC